MGEARLDEPVSECTCHPLTTPARAHVEPTYPQGTSHGGALRQPTHPDHRAASNRDQHAFARALESLGAVGPSAHQRANDADAFTVSVLGERVEAFGQMRPARADAERPHVSQPTEAPRFRTQVLRRWSVQSRPARDTLLRW